MFAESMTEAEVNRTGAMSDLRYFHTTYGTTFGYNERARKYHRSYGLVTPPNNPAFADYQLGDLAVAPLYRRNHYGLRVDYPDRPFTWTASASKLKKNQKIYGEEGLQRAEAPQLPPRRVEWHGSAAYPEAAQRMRDFGSEDEWTEEKKQQYMQQQREFEERFAARQRQQEQEQAEAAAAAAAQAATFGRNGRAILTSSVSNKSRLLASSPSASQSLSEAEKQLQFDALNPNRYPLPSFKTSPHNPQFDAPPIAGVR